MKFSSKVLTALALVVCASTASAYEFVVSNKTSVKITGIQASEDGKTWGAFDVKGGVAAGADMNLVWSSETDDSGCEWQVKALYADGSESEPAPFDFCEDDLVLEFTE